MLVTELLLAVSSGVVVITDVRSRKISNKICILILLCCLFISLENESIKLQFIQAVLVVVFGLTLFSLGVVGAGDVKLLSCYSLIISPKYWLLTLMLIGFIGGICAITILVKNLLFSRQENFGVPYGIPIVISSLFFIHLTIVS